MNQASSHPASRLAQRIALVALVAAVSPAAALAAEPVPQPWRVVLLRSSDSHLPASIAADTAFREALAGGSKARVEIYSQDLDTLRFTEGELDAELLALLRKKHQARPPHVVLAMGASALRFAERHHDAIWPGASLVFMLLDEAALDAINPKRASGGVVSRYDINAGLDLAVRLQPDAKRVVFVSGAAEYDRHVEQTAIAALARYKGPLEATFLRDLSLAEASSRLSRLPQGTIVFALSMFRDREGQAFAPVEAASRMAEAASVPTLFFIDTGVGRGVVGGVVVQPADHGKIGAEMTLAILSGSAVAAPAIRVAPSRCVVDWRQLRRWDIGVERVPADCEVRFREYTFLERHWIEALVIATVIVLQAALIAALLIQLRRRRRAELASRQYLAEVAHATRLATVGELTASIAHEINQPLGAILSNADAAELILEANPGSTLEVRQILEDIRADGMRASEVIRRLRNLLSHRQLDARPVELNGLIAEAVAFVDGDALRRGVRIELNLDPMLAKVLGDPVHLRQVITNLVINAMEAMTGVAEELREVRVSTATEAGGARIEVADRGPGISEANLPRLFDSFFTTKEGGLGLGLSIVRTIVEAHAGRVSAHNRAEGGAVFVVWLPAA